MEVDAGVAGCLLCVDLKMAKGGKKVTEQSVRTSAGWRSDHDVAVVGF